MATLDRHIRDLLFDHDCVILPLFGGFLASDQPANIHDQKHLIYPPYRKIAFNVFLKENDGLLANYFAQSENISYPEALRKIQQQVEIYLRELNSGQKIIFEQIGQFYLDPGKNLQFIAFRSINFHLDSFGLSPVTCVNTGAEYVMPTAPVLRKKAVPIRPSIPKENKKPVIFKHIRQRYLGIVAIAGALLWFSFNLYLIKPHQNLSTLNLFQPEKFPLPLADSQIKSTPPVQVLEINPVVAPTDSSLTASNEPAKPEIKESLPVQVSPQPAPVIEASPQKQGSYSVIGGVFRIQSNAEGFVEAIKSKGFDSAHIFQKGSLYYVSFHSFENRQDAIALLDSLNRTELKGWVYHN